MYIFHLFTNVFKFHVFYAAPIFSTCCFGDNYGHTNLNTNWNWNVIKGVIAGTENLIIIITFFYVE